ncbi:MAG: diheme cytochrome c-553 [Ignavibacteriaceae bacterium]|nr:diheme cytochrome c-553 [Ignavibacteriaceae bacterium]
MRNTFFIAFTIAMCSVLLFLQVNCTQQVEQKPLTQEELIARGSYIVNSSGCGDCHTPKIMSPNGPVEDTTRFLSGFPAEDKLPPLDLKTVAPGNWYVTEKNLAAWVGPWGISYASNITPDNETGIGTLSEEMFIKTIREGKLMGVGRPLLPPMPWPMFARKTDEDLKAIYAYLMSIKPVKNKVPDPVPPPKLAEYFSKK